MVQYAWSGLGNGDPWIALDGRVGAPSGTPQYSTGFNGLNGATPLAFRPPWKVAGIDYYVGIDRSLYPTNGSLKDPSTISSSLMVASGSAPILLTTQADNITLDGYDFTLGGTHKLNIQNTGFTVTNSKFQDLCFDASVGGFLVKNCEIDGLKTSGETSFGCLFFIRGVPGTFRYCWMYNPEVDFIDQATADLDVKYCLFDTLGWAATGHQDAIQFAGAGTANNIIIQFNTYIHTSITADAPSSFIDLETQNDAGATMNDPVVAYNTAIFNMPGQTVSASTMYRISQTTGRINRALFHDNWSTNINLAQGPAAVSVSSPGSVTETNNRVLEDNSIFT